MISVTPIYAALLAVLMAGLSVRVGVLRGINGVALGDGQSRALALAIRRFGNLSEYAAMALVLMLLMELQGVSYAGLHAYGAGLVTLRLVHPIALFDDLSAPFWKKAGRFVSAAGTAMLLAIGAAVLLWM